MLVSTSLYIYIPVNVLIVFILWLYADLMMVSAQDVTSELLLHPAYISLHHYRHD